MLSSGDLCRYRATCSSEASFTRGHERISKIALLALPPSFSTSRKNKFLTKTISFKVVNSVRTNHVSILQNIYVIEKDYNSAVQILGAGVDFAFMARASYTRMLFWLSKAMLYLLERKFADANPILHQTGPMIEAWVQQNSHHQKESVAKQQKEYLQIFFLVLQVMIHRAFNINMTFLGIERNVEYALDKFLKHLGLFIYESWQNDNNVF